MGIADQQVSQSKIFIDGPMGNFQLRRVKSFDIDDESDVEVTMAVGVSGGAGVRFKEGGGSISLEVYREQGKPEVDWAKHKRLRSQFNIVVQDTGGQREQYQQCFVAKVPRKDDDAGQHMMQIKLVYLQGPIPLPPAT